MWNKAGPVPNTWTATAPAARWRLHELHRHAHVSKWHACNAQVQGTTAIVAACSISGTTLTVTAQLQLSVWGIFLY